MLSKACDLQVELICPSAPARAVVAGVVDAEDAAALTSVTFHTASGIDADAVARVQTDLRRRILRAFVDRGLLESFVAKEMLGYLHSGFSLDVGVCIEGNDRAALEQLLRYCARPPPTGGRFTPHIFSPSAF